MDRILITGGNGYVAKSLYNALKDRYNITIITRHDFDLTAFEAMNKFFQNKYFDVVIHCAVQGGSRLRVDSYKDMDVNLTMYYNLLQHKPHYNKLIHFGSGAEIYNSGSPYGLSKKIIAKSISEIDNFYNVRIFGVFDENELNTRFIKSNIIRYINEEPMIIHQNKFMDFFYMKDLASLMEFYIFNNKLKKEINCTYSETLTLLDIANYINTLSDYKVDINIENKNIESEYMGQFDDIGLNYIGLKEGIKNIYNKLKNKI